MVVTNLKRKSIKGLIVVEKALPSFEFGSEFKADKSSINADYWEKSGFVDSDMVGLTIAKRGPKQ